MPPSQSKHSQDSQETGTDCFSLVFLFFINPFFEGIVGLFEYQNLNFSKLVKDSIWTREFEVRFKEKYNSECF